MSLKNFSRCLAFPIVACGGQWWWMAHYAPTNIIASAVWIPLLTFAWFCIGGTSHEIVHGNLIINKTLGTAIGRIIGTVLGIPYTVYKEVHMRHHAYLNTPLDWEMWPYGDPDVSLRFRRIFVWCDILFAIVLTPFIWGRICFSPRSPVAPKLRRTMRLEYLAIAVFWFGVIGSCIYVHRSGIFLFRPEHWIFAAPPLLATMGNGLRKLMDHVGTSSFDPFHGTRTVVGQNFITKTLSYFNFDLSIHGPHHRYPKLDHSLLKRRMTEIADANPEQTYPVFPSFFSALIDTMRTITRNPGVGLNAGCTEDLSHLPLRQPAETPPATPVSNGSVS
ncbi:MAG: fatty acid desaturase [Fuerstiella sp.]